jgi:hypothetical protein
VGCFEQLPPGMSIYIQGSGLVEPTGDTLRLVKDNTSAQQVTDAQIDDYHRTYFARGLPRRRFRWRPPLTLTVRARFSHPAGDPRTEDALSGTAGFGFWNDPFMMTGARFPTLPRAIWFFYASRPSDVKLHLGTPGHGWKAATIDANRWPFFLLAPTAPVAVPLMNFRPLYRALWPIGQRAIGVCEAPIAVDMTAWHTYRLRWDMQAAQFEVDGKSALVCDTAPRGPLGFVIWLDNQYLVITPWGRFRYGLLDAPGQQWMEVDLLSIEPAV